MMNKERQKQHIEKWVDRGLTLFCWAGALLLLWGVMQVFCFTSFKIPSDSMEPGLVAGDYIAVNKLIYGARLFDVFDALDKKEVTIERLPGLREINRNDVVVFNFPYPARWDSIGFDVMKYYVKRCIALPGDTVEIRDGLLGIRGYQGKLGNVSGQSRLSHLPDSLIPKGVLHTFPYDKTLNWTVKNFGPLAVPARGRVVAMDSLSYSLYRQLIGWEQKKKLRMVEGCVCLGDSAIFRYRFRENYYFVSGDKADNSQDSRYWGMLPESYIVGKATFIWKSKGEDGIRWNRIFKRVE